MQNRYYLIEGMTRIVATAVNKIQGTDDEWLSFLQSLHKLSVHVDLEKQLEKEGYKDGDEIPATLFIPAAVPLSMEDQFTS